ncbi:PTS sugar transporter subunit IIA [Lacticaseibacillus zeae]|uniref:PTS N-acetylglucosamine transporter subunit IIBC n=1 Tax=Lacticaseibacillus zeae subsp. silagei TaxID=3068307 RepID=A0ABD7ZAW3_LACZE|nr:MULTISPECIES: PTS N-acetylglucosamine transporter subunit IIBC [Lacticaseibacillus]MDE3314438.1 PTS N-acetylglucosamine transporter subunit IIBC [Lacticaseibacillus zeae]OFR98970.1 PTS N-acetylglucosamine transporter subunit IIBC [Lactobacillus sp. HMSC068F07]WLV84066.1 PTS N-acetylglucosamine transporter subunit IIBC [Lacticaseibacillus sp. NCIMB 15475]WLV86821.1 PTS N-acetylglucosamine transporter subunit IIBC [Lacticaseibacillus sp. NCIMB 15474]
MKRTIIIASHVTLAKGMAETLRFFSGEITNVQVLTAYVDNQSIDAAVNEIFDEAASDDEVIVLTDLKAGSVNQKFFKYIQRPHTQLVTGMNLALAMGVVMEPSTHYLTAERMETLVDQAKADLTYMNAISLNGDEDDE